MDSSTCAAAFTENGTEIPQTLLQRVADTCNEYNITAEDLASQWESFALNQKNMDTNVLNVKSLESLRSHVKRIQTRKANKSSTFRRKPAPATLNKKSAKASFSTPSPLKRSAPDSNSSTVGANKRAATETAVKSKDVASMLKMQSTYKDRKNRGQLAGTTFNPKSLIPRPEHGGSQDTPRCQIELVSKEQEKWCADRSNLSSGGHAFAGGAMHMYTSPTEKADVLESRLHAMSRYIVANHNLDVESVGIDDLLEPVGMPSQVSVLVCGRLCCHIEGNDGMGSLNAQSLLLEGSRTRSNGVRVRLDVRKLSKFDLYPGQIVVVRGTTNENGSEMIAEEIFENGSPESTTSSVRELKVYNDTLLSNSPVEMLVAAGPFCVVDNLEFDPLEDFGDVVIEKKPDVVLLIGPFVDTSNTKIQLGDINLDDGEGGKMPVTFADLFRFRVTAVLERILPEVPGCRVLIVPSCDDAHHQCTYPQAKFDLEDLLYDGCDRELIESRVTLLPNPSVFKINELEFGVNSADVMRHLLREDVCRVPQDQKKPPFTARLPFHLWHQRSFYPLYPAGQNASGQPEIAVDLGRAEQLTIGDHKPDCMIMCSKLNHFANDCENVLCLNPGRLTKGVSGGTYARVVIQPYDLKKLEGKEDDARVGHDMLERAAVEVSFGCCLVGCLLVVVVGYWVLVVVC